MTNREYAKNLFSKWIDDDWLDQPRFDKLFWEALNGTRSVNLIGVAPINFTRWRRMMRDGPQLATDMELKAALIRLGRRRYVYVDENTGEYLIRSRMRRDDLDKQPTSFLSALRMIAVLDSRRFAVPLRSELERLSLPVISTARNEAAANRLQDALKRAWDAARSHLDTLAEGMPDPFPDPFLDDFPDGIPGGMRGGISRPAETEAAQIPPGMGSHIPPISGSGSGSGSSTLVGGYVGEGAAETGNGNSAALWDSNEPPANCPKHRDDPDPPACGACGRYNERRKRWLQQRAADIEAAKRAAAEAERAQRREAAELNAQAIATCDLCDETGYRSGVVCDHVDRTETARAGAALVRAALAKHTPDDQEDTNA
ncbi:hypothetical protein [Mycobacterium sp. TY813]|uniref:hypothetical protein n=1 Tax=Mycobacterium TaxID=1763 RepID=UPI0027428ABD|nr:hypothetical protein [Mycobacterium sp. TY813]MDP7729525.1 hypothetical protein [Mycobacterium sp. TY813]